MFCANKKGPSAVIAYERGFGQVNDQSLKTRIFALHKGDKQAFSEIYEQLKTPVYTIALRILYDRAEAEDVTQEVFLRLFRSPPDPSVKKPRAWIFQMARNLAIDGKRRPAQSALSDEMEDTGHPPEDAIGTKLDIEAALRRLCREDREIVTLHINAGLRFREIADMMGKPLGTVLWRYQKSIGRLRAYLS